MDEAFDIFLDESFEIFLKYSWISLLKYSCMSLLKYWADGEAVDVLSTKNMAYLSLDVLHYYKRD